MGLTRRNASCLVSLERGESALSETIKAFENDKVETEN